MKQNCLSLLLVLPFSLTFASQHHYNDHPRSMISTVDSTQSKCSCTPLVYKWRLDFSRSCPPANIQYGSSTGIADVFCVVSVDTITGTSSRIPPADSARSRPVNISSYTILELNQMLLPLKIEQENDIALQDGDIITFTSVMASYTSPGQYPGGMQVNLMGVNSDGEDLRLSWIVQFTNNCEVKVYEVGDSLGWMVFENDEEELPPKCSAPTTLSPTSTLIPTSSKPTSRPSTMPTLQRVPTAKPSKSVQPSPNPSVTTPMPTSSSPSSQPSTTPTSSIQPSPNPTVTTPTPTSSSPTSRPSAVPTLRRVPTPTPSNSVQPSSISTIYPTQREGEPTSMPSHSPTFSSKSPYPTLATTMSIMYSYYVSSSTSMDYSHPFENDWIDVQWTDYVFQDYETKRVVLETKQKSQ